MKVFAIGDIHLAGDGDKPMDIFGQRWLNHVDSLTQNWVQLIHKEDIVLIPGDISWAMKINQAKKDLERIENLPGQKICVRGNHDYWWDRPGKLNAAYQTTYFLQNKAYILEDIAICGTRGWTCPNDISFTVEDDKIFKRELIRLQLSLEDAMQHQAREIIVMLHYPPVYNRHDLSPIISLLKEYPVTQVVYGHLHDDLSWNEAIQGFCEGITYHLVSADYLNFLPLLIKVL